MFAIAVWDRRERTLTLVRDRLGIKPLYWAKFGELFLFGSELKALRAHPGWTPRIDRGAVAAFMRHSYVPGAAAIYGACASWRRARCSRCRRTASRGSSRFWIRPGGGAGGAARLRCGAAMTELTDQLDDAAAGRSEAAHDRRRAARRVPVRRHRLLHRRRADAGAERRPVQTFTIGFENAAYNEAQHAAAVARHLGTDHTELT